MTNQLWQATRFPGASPTSTRRLPQPAIDQVAEMLARFPGVGEAERAMAEDLLGIETSGPRPVIGVSTVIAATSGRGHCISNPRWRTT